MKFQHHTLPTGFIMQPLSLDIRDDTSTPQKNNITINILYLTLKQTSLDTSDTELKRAIIEYAEAIHESYYSFDFQYDDNAFIDAFEQAINMIKNSASVTHEQVEHFRLHNHGVSNLVEDQKDTQRGLNTAVTLSGLFLLCIVIAFTCPTAIIPLLLMSTILFSCNNLIAFFNPDKDRIEKAGDRLIRAINKNEHTQIISKIEQLAETVGNSALKAYTQELKLLLETHESFIGEPVTKAAIESCLNFSTYPDNPDIASNFISSSRKLQEEIEDSIDHRKNIKIALLYPVYVCAVIASLAFMPYVAFPAIIGFTAHIVGSHYKAKWACENINLENNAKQATKLMNEPTKHQCHSQLFETDNKKDYSDPKRDIQLQKLSSG